MWMDQHWQAQRPCHGTDLRFSVQDQTLKLAIGEAGGGTSRSGNQTTCFQTITLLPRKQGLPYLQKLQKQGDACLGNHASLVAQPMYPKSDPTPYGIISMLSVLRSNSRQLILASLLSSHSCMSCCRALGREPPPSSRQTLPPAPTRPKTSVRGLFGLGRGSEDGVDETTRLVQGESSSRGPTGDLDSIFARIEEPQVRMSTQLIIILM